MKLKGQGKKEYIVLKFDDYINDWITYSKPVTIGQASWLVNHRKTQTKFKIERIAKS
jgi:hypothetical protein